MVGYINRITNNSNKFLPLLDLSKHKKRIFCKPYFQLKPEPQQRYGETSTQCFFQEIKVMFMAFWVLGAASPQHWGVLNVVNKTSGNIVGSTVSCKTRSFEKVGAIIERPNFYPYMTAEQN
jgi:hypothetical protein